MIKGFWWRFWWLLALAITVFVSTAVYVVTEVCK